MLTNGDSPIARAAIYARASTARCIEQQHAACRESANRDGVEIDPRLKFLDIGPAIGDCSGFDALISAARAGRVDIVFVASPSRITRSASCLKTLLRSLAESQIRVVFADGSVAASMN